MRRSAARAAQALAITTVLVFSAGHAVARGGAGIGHAGIGQAGFGQAGFGHGGFGRAGFARLGRPHGFDGRIAGIRGRRQYFPAGGYGGFGGYGYGYGGYYPGGAAGDPAMSQDRSDLITTRSTIIHRGPAFGEPGYYSHGAIYRITSAPTSRAGKRRFNVERLNF